VDLWRSANPLGELSRHGPSPPMPRTPPSSAKNESGELHAHRRPSVELTLRGWILPRPHDYYVLAPLVGCFNGGNPTRRKPSKSCEERRRLVLISRGDEPRGPWLIRSQRCRPSQTGKKTLLSRGSHKHRVSGRYARKQDQAHESMLSLHTHARWVVEAGRRGVVGREEQIRTARSSPLFIFLFLFFSFLFQIQFKLYFRFRFKLYCSNRNSSMDLQKYL
jgi:hypothetical protein